MKMKTKQKLIDGALKFLQPPPQMTVTEWAEKNFILPSTSAEPGKFRVNRIPYAAEIMDAFTQNDVHKVAVKSSAQIGKSTILLAVIGRFVQLDPCAMMIIQPTLEMAQDFSKDRLQRMIDDCNALTPLFFDNGKTRNVNQTILSKFFVGGRVVLQGANSPAGLASRPIRILLCDEVDRFPNSAGDEGDPVSLAEKRQTTFFNYKTGIFSTPTVEGVSRIDVEYNLGTQEEWRHQCPNCGEWHFLNFRDMEVDSFEKVDEYKRKNVVVNSVKWRCPDCGNDFSEQQIKNSPQKFFAQNPQALKNGVRSFWINGFSSQFVSWQTIMKEYLESKGDNLREAVVFNTRFGLSYSAPNNTLERDENEFLRRRVEYNAQLPESCLILTAAVDVQHDRLEFEVAGWGAGEIRYGVLRGNIFGNTAESAVWAELDKVLDADYKFADGRALKISRTFVDSGYNTDAVYNYCERRQVRGVFPIKGKSGAIPLLYQFGKPKNSNVILVILGVDTGKAEVMARLEIAENDAKSMVFPKSDTAGYNEIYFKELLAERLVAKKSGGQVKLVWEKSQTRNESLDLAVYNLAACQSCVAGNENFWQERAAPESVPKKSTVRKTAVSRSIDIY